MSAKQFFKGTAFKCIVVLLAIVLVCGVFLTICNSLFFVSAEERTQRTLSKLYGGETVEYIQEELDESVSVTNCTVNSVYKITTYEGDYVLNVTGNGGYSGGTVTCGIVVQVENGSVKGIKSAAIESNSGQSYISKIGTEDIRTMIDKQNEDGFTSYNTSGISTGATFSMGAIANALNGARDYVNQKYCGAVSKFADYAYSAYIGDATEISVSGETVTYSVVTQAIAPANEFRLTIVVGSDGKISSFRIDENGSTYDYGNKMLNMQTNLVGKTLSEIEALLSPLLNDGAYNYDNEDQNNAINTGATKSNFLCLYAGAFATANYDKAKEDFAEGGTDNE